MLESGPLEGPPARRDRRATLPRAFGSYELMEEVARGGMGIVYRARQTQINRVVALKVLAAGLFAAPDSVARFRTEAEAAASLDHPNIVPIYEVGECEGQPFFSMRFVEGGSLAQRLSRRRSGEGSPAGEAGPHADAGYGQAEAVELLVKLARAVHYAHQRGILHRDIKPGNILLDGQGEPHLTDFGVAKLVEKESTLTRTMAMLGTPSYMAPEQARGEVRQFTTAVDVYGLGAVFYQLLTGEPPFAGGTTMETVRQVLEREPRRPSALKPTTDRDLESICLKCLEKDPARRYDSAEALAADLERWQRHEPIAARPPSAVYVLQKLMRRHQAAFAALAVIALLLVAGVMASTWQAVRATRAEALARQRLTESKVNERRALEARRQADAETEQRRRQLVRLHVAAGNKLVNDGDGFTGLLQFFEALRLDAGDAAREEVHRRRFAAVLRTAPRLAQFWAGSSTLNTARFSPDGTRVVCGDDQGGTRIFDAGTWEPLLPSLRMEPPAALAWFTGDGTLFATVDDSGRLRHWDAQTGRPAGPLLPTEIRSSTGRTYFDCVDYSADGHWVIAAVPGGARFFDVKSGEPAGPLLGANGVVRRVRFNPKGGKASICGAQPAFQILEVPSGRVIWTLPDPGEEVRFSAFSPDGTQVAIASGPASRNVDLWEVARGERVRPTIHPGSALIDLQFSPDGRYLVMAQVNFARAIEVRTGQPAQERMNHSSHLTQMDFSPDGSRLATVSYDQTARVWDLARSRSVFPFLRHTGPVFEARFSRDGQRLLTTCSQGTVRLWELPPGGGERLRLPHGISRVSRAQFSPEGRRILSFGEGRGVRVWDARSGQLIALWNDVSNVPAATFNRDGTRVALAASDGVVRVRELATDDELFSVRHAARANHVEFSPDGTRLLTASDDGTARLWKASDGSPAAPVFSHGSPICSSAFSADGRRVITGSQDGLTRVWDAQSGAPVGDPLKLGSNVLSVALTSDGRRGLTTFRGSGEDGTQLWDARTGRPIGPKIVLYGTGWYPAAFSPDGRRYLVLQDVNSVAILDAETGGRAAPLLGHVGLPTGFAFSPDGRLVLTWEDVAVRVWDAATGEPVTPPLQHPNVVSWGTWSPDGREVLTSAMDGAVRVWDVSPVTSTLAELGGQAELLAAHRLDTNIGPVPLTPAEMKARWRDLRK